MEIVLTPQLQKRFLQFHERYMYHRDGLAASNASGQIVARDSWTFALHDEFLTLDELKLYKKLIAMHSVNGGELFAVGPVEDPEEGGSQ